MYTWFVGNLGCKTSFIIITYNLIYSEFFVVFYGLSNDHFQIGNNPSKMTC